MGYKGTPVGLSSLYYAELEADASGGASYKTPVRVVGAIEAGINPNASTGTLYGDDGPMDSVANLGEITLELNVADIPLDILAKWLGHEISGGVLKRLSTNSPIWVAVGYKALKSNGKYRYTWLLKGKFLEPEENSETRSDTVNFQTRSITGNFVKREYDDGWIRQTDEDLPGFEEALATNWFTDPDYTL